jgi:hypothetical protein
MEKGTNWEKIKEGVRKYTWIMDNLHKTDVSKDREFQKAFNHFYRIRQKKQVFYDSLYDYLEKNKNNPVTFKQTLTYFFDKLGSLEASFSSKVVATINPNMPVWDSVVLKNIGLKPPPYYKSYPERIQMAIDTYNKIINWYDDHLTKQDTLSKIQLFDREIGKTNLTPIKKADLILWQTRN